MGDTVGLRCDACGQIQEEQALALSCPACQAPLRIAYPPEGLARRLSATLPRRQGQSLLRQWREVLPIPHPELIDRVSLGEAPTPLLRASWLSRALGVELLLKIEIGPASLSLKDRGTSLCALKAVEFGHDTLCVASSGNNAASVAAYAARAGLQAVVFLQREVSAAKIRKIQASGARIIRVDGDMAAASRLCRQMAERRRWFQAGGPSPYRVTAKRTVAFEIAAQLGGGVPDAVLFPSGGCTGLVAAHLGFQELMEAGCIPRIPRLIGVQLAACDPVARAFEAGEQAVAPVTPRPSLSDALLNANPYWGAAALRAARESGGAFVSVPDEGVMAMVRALGTQEGLFVEPAGAVAVAGLARLLREGRLAGVRQVVCTLTGHGLNGASGGDGESNLLPILPPDPEAVEAYLG